VTVSSTSSPAITSTRTFDPAASASASATYRASASGAFVPTATAAAAAAAAAAVAAAEIIPIGTWIAGVVIATSSFSSALLLTCLCAGFIKMREWQRKSSLVSSVRALQHQSPVLLSRFISQQRTEAMRDHAAMRVAGELYDSEGGAASDPLPHRSPSQLEQQRPQQQEPARRQTSPPIIVRGIPAPPDQVLDLRIYEEESDDGAIDDPNQESVASPQSSPRSSRARPVPESAAPTTWSRWWWSSQQAPTQSSAQEQTSASAPRRTQSDSVRENERSFSQDPPRPPPPASREKPRSSRSRRSRFASAGDPPPRMSRRKPEKN
jgi:hypothetical protein